MKAVPIPDGEDRGPASVDEPGAGVVAREPKRGGTSPAPSPSSSSPASEPENWNTEPPAPAGQDLSPPWSWRRFRQWGARMGLARNLVVILSGAALCTGFATYAALTESTVIGPADLQTLTVLLTLDVILLLLLGGLIARRVVQISIGRKRGLAGSRLHVRLVAMFSLLAVAPAIIVAGFSAVFFYVGVQQWFGERVRTAVHESLEVARAYLHEHQQNIRADALAMANDLNQEAARLLVNPARFTQVVSTQAALRALSEAIVFRGGTGQVVARSGLTFALEFEPVPEESLLRARAGEVVLMINEADDRVRALVRLDRFFDTFLFVGRSVESRVINHMASANAAVREYSEAEGSRSSLQVTFTLVFIMMALLLLTAAVWAGLNFATRLATPIASLIAAAERVRAGDLEVRVAESEDHDELAVLSRAFNRMTSQIAGQRSELVEANAQLDHRRQFTEAVLRGVSAGVIGLDRDGVINLLNMPAADLLGVTDPMSIIGRPMLEPAPEMVELLDIIIRRPGRLAESHIQIRRPGVLRRTLLVRMAAEIGEEGAVAGYVVTLDDITELLSAQRKAAWADVARRIAHEIKNPLTPIQLSAERLSRKYLKQITNDPDTFRILIETISRQVDDIRRMVDEFSAFARMPQPVMKPYNLNEICRQAVFLQINAHPGVKFECEVLPQPLTIPCDSRQLSQALTNLIQNALDAIEGRMPPPPGEELPGGWVRVSLVVDSDRAVMTVEDNGKGLPNDVEHHRLTEPYVTTRSKGTGLGLAIVRKIMEDHGGEISLVDRPGGGARISLIIPVAGADPETAAAPPPSSPQAPHGS